jgi:hypothetical protein
MKMKVTTGTTAGYVISSISREHQMKWWHTITTLGLKIQFSIWPTRDFQPTPGTTCCMLSGVVLSSPEQFPYNRCSHFTLLYASPQTDRKSKFKTCIKNEMLSFAGKWMESENIILSEISLAQKTKNRMFSLICGH